ncbi:MAG: hypothetical protein ACRCWR_10715 [Saezia sp.]
MSTQNTLPDWERPYFSQVGNSNLHFFVVYGKAISEMNIPGDVYRITYMSEGLNISGHSQDTNPEALNQFRENVFQEMLQNQHPELLTDVQACDHCYIIQGMLPDKSDLNDIRLSVGIVTYLLDNGAVAVFDPAAYKWWTPQEWRKQVFEPEKLDPLAHVSILISPEHNESRWVYTHGLRKFGRPDLSVHYVNEEEMDAVLEMINRFIVFMAQGGSIEEGQEVQMHALPEGMICRHKNTMDDPTFNNNHVEISWPDPDEN